ncbi:hypothetical protein TNCV_1185521 [Trichonephila clavipes]|nr:hypothetical protein TNCV_1185521 [Trichonephila clavipes]
MAIPFTLSYDPEHSLVSSSIIIHQKEFITNNSSMWMTILIKDLVPISYTNWNSSKEQMQASLTTEGDLCLNHDSTTSVTMSFIVGSIISSASFLELKLVYEEYRSLLLSCPGDMFFY